MSKKPKREIKYYTAGEKTKTHFFKLLAQEDVVICVIIVDKMNRKISDTPENYAALCVLLLEDVVRITSKIGAIYFDRHFSKNVHTKTFETIVRSLVGYDIPIYHVDSKRDRRVNVADMVAGAMLAHETGRDIRFANMIKQNIRNVQRINWWTVKINLMTTKNLPEPV